MPAYTSGNRAQQNVYSGATRPASYTAPTRRLAPAVEYGAMPQLVQQVHNLAFVGGDGGFGLGIAAPMQGNCLVAWVNASADVTSMSGGGVTWFKAAGTISPANYYHQVWYGLSSDGLGSTSFNLITGPSALVEAMVAEFSGVESVSALDFANAAIGTGSNPEGSSAGIATDLDLILASVEWDDGGQTVTTHPPGYTSLAAGTFLQVEYMVGEPGLVRGPIWALSASLGWATTVIGLKALAPAPPPTLLSASESGSSTDAGSTTADASSSQTATAADAGVVAAASSAAETGVIKDRAPTVPVFVQDAKTPGYQTVDGSGVIVVSFPSAPLAGSCLVVWINNSGLNVTGVTGGGGTWTKAGAALSPSFWAHEVWVAPNVSGAGTADISIISSAGGGLVDINIAEFAMVDPSSPVESFNAASGSGTVASSPSSSSSGSGVALVSLEWDDINKNITAFPPEYTALQTNDFLQPEYALVGTGPIPIASWTISGAIGWASAALVLRAAPQNTLAIASTKAESGSATDNLNPPGAYDSLLGRTEATGWGTAPSGHVWAEVAGDWQIDPVTGGYMSVATNHALVAVDVGTSVVRVGLTLASLTIFNEVGIAFCILDSLNFLFFTSYGALYKCIAGAFVSPGSTAAMASGDRIEVDVSATGFITCYVNSVSTVTYQLDASERTLFMPATKHGGWANLDTLSRVTKFSAMPPLNIVASLPASESATSTEATSTSVTVPTASDTGAAADTMSAQGRSGAETSAGGDTTTTQARVLNETAAGVEAITAQTRSNSETAAGADATSSSTASMSSADTGSGVDAFNAQSRVVPELGTAADAGVLIAATSSSETGAGVDTFTSNAAAASSTEAGTSADAGSVAAGVAGSDVGAGADSYSSQARMAPDAGSASDAGAVAATTSSSETGVVVDSLDAQGRVLSETGSTADSGSFTESTFSTSASDTGGSADTGALLALNTDTEAGSSVDTMVSQSRQLQELAVGVDSFASNAAALSSSDTGVGSDSASYGAQTSAADTGSSTDTMTAQGRSIPESSAGVDTASNQSRSNAEFGLAVDALSAQSRVDAESSSGADSVSSQARFLGELGAVADAGFMAATSSAAEVGVGADTFGLLAASSSASETGAVVDASTAPQANSSAVETGSATEASNSTATLSSTEVATGADSGSSPASVSVAETAAGVDVGGATASGFGSESATSSEAGSTVATSSRGDSGTSVEAGAPAASLSTSDVGVAADTGSFSAALASSEAGTPVESVGTMPQNASDTGAAVDASSLTAALSNSDSGVAVDASVGIGQAASDTAFGVDNRVVTAASSSAETGAGADTAGSTAQAVTQTGSASDIGSTTASSAANEAGVASDAATPVTANSAASEAGSLVDAGAVGGSALIASDTGGSVESAQSSAITSSSESAIGTDVSTTVPAIAASQTGSGLDGVSTTATQSASQAGTSVESGSLLAQAIASEVGVGLESTSLLVAMQAAEVAAGAEGGVLMATMVATDSGSSTETPTLVVAVALFETGAGVEAFGSLSALLASSEAALAVDSPSSTQVTFSSSEVGSGADVGASLESGNDKSANEVVSIVDASTLAVTASVTESSFAVDAASGSAVLAASQVATGQDTSGTTAFGSADTGSVVDVGDSFVSYVVGEAAFVVEQALTLAYLLDAEFGVGLEAVIFSGLLFSRDLHIWVGKPSRNWSADGGVARQWGVEPPAANWKCTEGTLSRPT